MRQLGDLVVWAVLAAVVASVIYFTPVIIRQVSGVEQMSFSEYARLNGDH